MTLAARGNVCPCTSLPYSCMSFCVLVLLMEHHPVWADVLSDGIDGILLCVVAATKGQFLACGLVPTAYAPSSVFPAPCAEEEYCLRSVVVPCCGHHCAGSVRTTKPCSLLSSERYPGICRLVCVSHVLSPCVTQ